MKSAYTIVKTLILWEKISREMEKSNRYCFKVEPSANKLEIKQAVEQLFKVHGGESEYHAPQGQATSASARRASCPAAKGGCT